MKPRDATTNKKLNAIGYFVQCSLGKGYKIWVTESIVGLQHDSGGSVIMMPRKAFNAAVDWYNTDLPETGPPT